MGANGIRFQIFLAQGHTVITKIVTPNFKTRPPRLTYTSMFGKIPAICTGVHTVGVKVLEKLWPEVAIFWHKMKYLEDKVLLSQDIMGMIG